MELEGKKFLVLYLEDWQMRMVKDFLGVDCHTWTVPIEKGPVVRYMVRTPARVNSKRMYLTEWQRKEIADVAGESCEFIELVKGTIPKYRVPVEEFVRPTKGAAMDRLTLKLSDEQKKLIKTHFKVELAELDIGIPDMTHVMYRVNPDAVDRGQLLHFTAEQKEQIMKKFGVTCDYFELSDVFHLLYGVDPGLPKKKK